MHRCPIGDCTAQVPRQQLMCPRHWQLVPPKLRRAVRRAWRNGQGAGTRAHRAAVRACIHAARCSCHPSCDQNLRRMARRFLAGYRHPNHVFGESWTRKTSRASFASCAATRTNPIPELAAACAAAPRSHEAAATAIHPAHTKETNVKDIAITTLSGNLTRDVELRQLPSGADAARLGLATTTRRRNGEEWVDKTNYSRSSLRRASPRVRAVPGQGLARVRRSRARLAAMDRPAGQQTRGDHVQSPARCSSKAPAANQAPTATAPMSPRPLPPLWSPNRPWPRLPPRSRQATRPAVRPPTT